MISKTMLICCAKAKDSQIH